ncbi:MAG: hypothetical protein K0S49_2737 [Microbacterium sp.]|nr:hypothetical protein [Microbacterium sp.]
MTQWEHSERSPRTYHENDEVVGDGRDPNAVADALLGGRSIVMGGPLGSGKSFLRARVVNALRQRGSDPIMVRASAVLRHTYANVFEAASDARARALLRDDPVPASTIIVVDDIRGGRPP